MYWGILQQVQLCCEYANMSWLELILIIGEWGCANIIFMNVVIILNKPGIAGHIVFHLKLTRKNDIGLFEEEWQSG